MLLLPSIGWAYPAKVVGVHDGDTVTVLDEEKVQHKIRMGSIDTPELGQPYGQNARQAVAALVFGKTVEVEPVDPDRYGRTVAVLMPGEENVNRELVREGAAWAYRQYLNDPEMVKLEEDAGAHERGLWLCRPTRSCRPGSGARLTGFRHSRQRRAARRTQLPLLPAPLAASPAQASASAARWAAVRKLSSTSRSAVSAGSLVIVTACPASRSVGRLVLASPEETGAKGSAVPWDAGHSERSMASGT